MVASAAAASSIQINTLSPFRASPPQEGVSSSKITLELFEKVKNMFKIKLYLNYLASEFNLLF